jgi:hypothetical protein
LILNQKLSLIFSKISSIYSQNIKEEELRKAMVALLVNKKNKFPWTLDEVEMALASVLKNFQ